MTDLSQLSLTRYRINFAKTAAMRFTSHLDLHRTWERTLRRAGLPLAYSHGFNPHPKINLASALPLGFTSEGEVVDVWLENEIPLQQVTHAMIVAAPPGLKINQVQQVEEHAPTLQKVLEASEYVITFLEPFPLLNERLEEILSAGSLPRERRGKAYDLRPLILEARRLADDEQGHARLFVRMIAQEGATGRPEEVVDALGAVPGETLVHRKGLVFRIE